MAWALEKFLTNLNFGKQQILCANIQEQEER